MTGSRIRLDPSWLQRAGDALETPQMRELATFLRTEKAAGKTIYPPGSQIFAALDTTPFDAVKVVILGQDPYHGPGQAHGLCFSVGPGVATPPSLQNIFKEISRDLAACRTLPGRPLSLPRPQHGNLTAWARQGVLLLNAVLTVERGRPGSHQGMGWEGFTDTCIEALASEREGLVFLLWGSHAQAKGRLIDARRHLILKAPHPSPLSAHRGFLGCGHFSKTNRYLQDSGRTPIDWTLPDLTSLARPHASH
jgi:uracil-DNA glycosylase